MSPVAGTVRAGTVPAGWWDVTLGPLDAGAVWLPGSRSLQRRAVATVHPVTVPDAVPPPWTWGAALPVTSVTRTADGSDPVLGTDQLTFTLEDADAGPGVGTCVGLRWTASDGTVVQESVHRVVTQRTTDMPNQVPGAITVQAEHWLAARLRSARVPNDPQGGLAAAIVTTGWIDGVGILGTLLSGLAGAVEYEGLAPARPFDPTGLALVGGYPALPAWSDPLPPAATYGEVAAYITSGAYSACEVVTTATGLPRVRPRHAPPQAAGLVISTDATVGGQHALPAENLALQATAPGVTEQRHRWVQAPNPVRDSGSGTGGDLLVLEGLDGTWVMSRVYFPLALHLATLEIPWGAEPPERAIYVYGDYDALLGIDTRTATPWCAVQVQEACGAAEQLTLTIDSAYPVPVMGEWVRVKVDVQGRHLDGWYAVRGWTQPSGVAAAQWRLDWRRDGG